MDVIIGELIHIYEYEQLYILVIFLGTGKVKYMRA